MRAMKSAHADVDRVRQQITTPIGRDGYVLRECGKSCSVQRGRSGAHGVLLLHQAGSERGIGEKRTAFPVGSKR